MRSIRRSLLGYLLVLLAIALCGVGGLVDRLARAAMTAREEAETKRIEQMYDLRRQEARVKLDAELVSEARPLVRGVQDTLGRELGRDRRGSPGRSAEAAARSTEPPLKAPDDEVQKYRQRVAAALAGGPGGWPGLVTVPAFARYPNTTWGAYEAPRAAARLQLADVLRKVYVDDDEHAGFFQFNVVAYFPGYHGGHPLGVVRPARVGQDMPINLPALEKPGAEFYHDDVELPNDGGFFRRVVMGGNRAVPIWLAPSPLSPPAPGPVFGQPPPPRRPPDILVRVYVHYARPYSDLEARLAADQQDRDEQLAAVRVETGAELARLRGRLGLIGGATFLALVLGGWVFVARGLAPLRRLSEAVSQVSEKDFRLPVSGEELGRELAPIHARLNQTLDMLRRAFAREKQAVADISHELRTPIASLLATIDVSLRKPRSPDQYRATLEDCRAIARQLGNLVERIMTLASLDAGTARTAHVRTDPADLAVECAAVIRPLAEAHGLTFALTTAAPPELDTDPDKLREVLINLLHNAVEYNRPGGRVDLGVRGADGAVVFEVRDTGIGMPPETQAKIFERFFRADSSRHATGVHAGLGLAIVKEYVGRLGGTITVESEPDVGSTFRVTIPAASPTPPAQPAAPAPPAEGHRPAPHARGATAPARS